jgi:hypothetical protein
MTTTTASKFHLGPPQVAGPLAVYPIFGADEPRLVYRSLGQAVKHGAFVSEVDEDGDVNDVLACNASDQPVLLYEGELIYGARQNRTIDAPVLVPAGVELRVEVSCVEQGRWDGSQGDEHFAPAPHAVDPEIRRTKRASANRRSAAGAVARPEQGEVWREVASTLAEHSVVSASDALSDVYEARRPALDELIGQVRAGEGQVGIVVEISGQPVALDLVSRPDVFADLLPRLAQGYGLQAINVDVARPSDPSDQAAEGFLHAVLESRRRWLPTPGMGDAFALTRPSLHGCGLRAQRELISVSAFPAKTG